MVNIIGSIFYGNVLGIFLLAFFIKYVKGNAVFIAAIITQILIIIIWYLDYLPYLWLNLLGCVLVMLIAIFLQFFNNLKLGYANNQTYKMGNFRIGKNRS
ncbi:MAG: hypothetical protein ABS28_01480 [Cryomorphaceae bacterium BACL22 MAG-120619-bin32]|nr:MAG: hypothetical protein ABS28_01480 [Cryomorphaceae bacterium BACL22 MAG-120619-bin32]